MQVADLEVKRGICCLKADNIIRIFGQVEALQEGWIVRTVKSCFVHDSRILKIFEKFKEKAAFLRSLKDGEKPPPEFKPFNVPFVFLCESKLFEEKKWLRDKKVP